MGNRAGQRLGNYRLTRLLGKGGFAEVYLGEHLRLGIQAAVKVLYTRLASNDDAENFEKEARTIAHLKHPHIVRVLDYDVEDDTPFLVMDYAPGGTLRNRHPKRTILPFPTITSYVKQAADALQYAHDQRVIHRDVKPENMLVGEHEELLLSDFGIAIVAQSSRYQSTQNMGGTMAYIAPEQIQGYPRTASDQYSLGIVVYEWLSGDCPFHGSMTEIVAQHLAVSPSSLCKKVPTVPPAVEYVVLTALEKDPHKRFGSVQAFATALEQAYLPKQPIIINPPGRKSVQDNINISPPNVQSPSLPPTQPAAVSKPVGTTLYTYRGHSKNVHAVAWSPDGTRIASASDDKTVQVWDIVYEKKIITYGNQSVEVNAVAWSPDSKCIASASGDSTVQVWDVSTGGKIVTYRHSASVNAVAWSPDGQCIASGGDDHTVQVWQAL